MINLKNKKAIETAVLLSVIVLIVSFLVILFFWSRLYPGGGSTLREICSASIESRAAAVVPLTNVQVRESVPLKCTTEKVCITDMDHNCENMVFTKECPVRIVKVSNADQVLSELADSVYADYVMVGKGDKNFAPRDLRQKSYCLITSRISLDPEAKIDGVNSLKMGDLYNKLEEKKLDNGISYFQALYSQNNLGSLMNYPAFHALADKPLELQKEKMITFQLIEAGYFISRMKAIGAGGAAAYAVFTLGPGGVILIAQSAVVGGAAYLGTTLFTLPDPDAKVKSYYYIPPQIGNYDLEGLKALDCGSFESITC